MWVKSFPVLLSILGSISAYSVSGQSSTVTNTIVQPQLVETVNKIFSNNPPQQTEGIKVVIVYACGDQPQQPQQFQQPQQSSVDPSVDPIQTFVTSSQIAYSVATQVTETNIETICQNNECNVSTIEKTFPSTFATVAKITYTTTGTTDVKSHSVDPTVSPSQVSKSAGPIVIPTAVTTTSTVFSATAPPNSTYVIPSSSETLTTTEMNPLITKAPVSSSVSVTIDPSQFSKGVTVSAAANSTYTIPKFNQSVTNSSVNVLPTAIQNATQLTTLTSLTSSQAAQYTTIQVPVTTSISSGSYSNNSLSLGSSIVNATSYINITVPVSSIPTSSEAVVVSSGSSSLASVISLSLSSSLSSSSSSSSPVVSSSVPTPQVSTEATFVVSNSNNYNGDAFNVISTSNPPSVFSRQELPLSIPAGVSNNGSPIQTNKFYANLFLGDQTDMIWSWPYGLIWSTVNYYGFGVQHTNTSDRQYGSQDTNNVGVDSYYFNPTGNSEIIFSSTALSSSNNYLFVSDMDVMSVNVQLAATSTLGSDYIELPIVQGMGFVTAIYHGNSVPLLNSLIGVQTLTEETSSVLNSKILKYRATLFNGVEWLIYVTLPSSTTDFQLNVENPYNIEGSSAVDGLIIQVAVAPETSNLQKRDGSSLEGFYDQAAGQYVTNTEIIGTISGGVSAQYGFQYTSGGQSSSGFPIVFALPHHVESLVSSTSQCATGIKLASTTKGDMYAYLTDEILMAETLETDIQFLPWTSGMTKSLSYTPDQLTLLAQTANEELQVDIPSTVASMDSNYFSGKVIDKYAYILLVVHEILQDEAVTNATLQQMKDAFDIFINNEQYYPLMYDTKFGGVTSTSAQGGDTGADFGAGYYNDHHFHYGYFIHAAAIVGKVDKDLGGNWAETNEAWVNSLIRDVANPSKTDSYFPVYRMFDWFAGHSWAAGLFASGDGKNQESSSEDYNFAYGMKLWGNVIGDNSMESRGDLMLAVMTRAMNKYILYSDDNTVEPSEILPNKVSGIIYENKITYTTFFGAPNTNPEYVHGIHMLPITPASSLIRIPSFVQQEWSEQISTFINNVNSGWTGILNLNQALFDAQSSYNFFSSSSWNSNYLDNGQSRTWSLAFSGGVANST